MSNRRINAWTQFVRRAVSGESLNQGQIADLVGVSPSTIGNWIKGENFEQPTAALAIAFAHALGLKVPDAMVAAGYGDSEDYDGTVLTKPDPSALSTQELLDELQRRAECSDPKVRRRGVKGRFTLRPDAPPYQ